MTGRDAMMMCWMDMRSMPTLCRAGFPQVMR